MIIRVVADRMTLGDDLAEPANVFLLHRLAEREEVDQPPRALTCRAASTAYRLLAASRFPFS